MIHFYIAVIGISTIISMVNAGSPLQPLLKRGEGGLIQGLLGRQLFCDPGFALCNDEDRCCPVGGDCCNDGNCCGAGFYCILGTNGIGGCCLDGEVCFGPVPGNGNAPTTESTSTHTRTTTFTDTFFSTSSTQSTSPPPDSTPPPGTTTSPTSSSISSSGSPTFFAPQNTPTADAGYVNVFIPGNDKRITWGSNAWTDSSSSCNPTRSCRKTNTGQSSFTYIASSNSSGAAIYLDASFGSTDVIPELTVFINDESDLSPDDFGSFDVTVCEYSLITFLPVQTETINITVIVNDPLSNGKRQDSSWSFEFNGFMIGQQTATTSQGTPTSTTTFGGGSLSSSATASVNKPFGIIVAVAIAVLARGFL